MQEVTLMMVSDLDQAPPVHCLAPPYSSFEPIARPADVRAADLPLGSVLVVDLAEPADWDTLGSWVPGLRRRCPASPVVLRVRRAAGHDGPELARRAADLHMRAVLYDDEPVRETLQPALTDPASLTEGLEEWLELRGVQPPQAPVGLIGEIFRSAPAHAKLRGLLFGLGRPERTVRSWFERARLPGPGAWLAAAHATYAALRLQRERQKPLLTIAVECGYSDHSSLSRQAMRLFGARPGEIRQTLGWEGLLDRWLGRCGHCAEPRNVVA
jgi:AraC-like DNA-binding protein